MLYGWLDGSLDILAWLWHKSKHQEVTKNSLVDILWIMNIHSYFDQRRMGDEAGMRLYVSWGIRVNLMR